MSALSGLVPTAIVIKIGRTGMTWRYSEKLVSVTKVNHFLRGRLRVGSIELDARARRQASCTYIPCRYVHDIATL